jgi:hypothetical protein
MALTFMKTARKLIGALAKSRRVAAMGAGGLAIGLWALLALEASYGQTPAASEGQAPGGSAKERPRPPLVSFQVQNGTVADMLLEIHWATGARIVAAGLPSARGLTLSLQGVSAAEALERICSAAGMRAEVSGTYFVVSPLGWKYGWAPNLDEMEQWILLSEQERLEAARMLATLGDAQLAALASGQDLTRGHLLPWQRRRLDILWELVQWAIARSPDTVGTELREAALKPDAQVSFSLEARLWRPAASSLGEPPGPPPAGAEQGEGSPETSTAETP